MASTLDGCAPDPEAAYSEDGVDLTLIRWMLSLTPRERLEVLKSHQQWIERVKGHAARSD